jgi:phosphinothricin acetyltransferase
VGEGVLIRALEERDWPAVKAIFEEGIATRRATFETEAPSWQRWDGAHLPLRLVAEDDGEVLGWAALTPYSNRDCYRGVAESSVYVAGRARGRGVGRALMDELVRAADDAGYWTLLAGIFPENVESLALHRRCGFRVLGLHERLGQLDGEWKDVVLMERRSAGGTHGSPGTLSSTHSTVEHPGHGAAHED